MCLWGHFINTPQTVSYFFQEISTYFVLLSELGVEITICFLRTDSEEEEEEELKRRRRRAPGGQPSGNYGDKDITALVG